jgi:hypothetical protein
VHVNLFFPLKTTNKNNFIIRITDAFTKFAENEAIGDKKPPHLSMQFLITGSVGMDAPFYIVQAKHQSK